MADTDDIANVNASLVSNAQAPAKVMIDGNLAEQHPLQDQIEADRYINAKVATKKKGRGWMSGILSRFCPPGSV